MKPPLLLNENIPALAIARLHAEHFDVFAVAERCPGIDDRRVLALAMSQQRWLFTFDRDYGDLIFRQRLPPPPAVILLRVASYRPRDPATWIMALAGDERLWNQFTVYDGQTLRSRPFLHLH